MAPFEPGLHQNTFSEMRFSSATPHRPSADSIVQKDDVPNQKVPAGGSIGYGAGGTNGRIGARVIGHASAVRPSARTGTGLDAIEKARTMNADFRFMSPPAGDKITTNWPSVAVLCELAYRNGGGWECEESV